MRKHTRQLRHLIILVVVALIASSPSRGEEPVTIEMIQKAWQQRQDRIKSVKIRIDMKAMHPKEAQISPAGARYPAKDTIVDKKFWISFKDSKVRYAYESMVWSDQKGRYETNTLNTTFNGKVAKSLSVNEGATRTQGKIEAGNQYTERQAPDVLFLAAHFRPLDPEHHHLDLKEASIVTERRVINGARCVELRWENLKNKITDVYYIDPARDFSIVRVNRILKDVTMYHNDWTLAKHPIVGYVPETWKKSWPGSGGPIIAEDCRLSVDVNENCPDSEFEITFPPGCVGIDYIAKKQFRIPDNGEQPKSEPRPLPKPSTGFGWFTWLASLSAASMLTACIYLWKVRGRSKS